MQMVFAHLPFGQRASAWSGRRRSTQARFRLSMTFSLHRLTRSNVPGPLSNFFTELRQPLLSLKTSSSSCPRLSDSSGLQPTQLLSLTKGHMVISSEERSNLAQLDFALHADGVEEEI